MNVKVYLKKKKKYKSCKRKLFTAKLRVWNHCNPAQIFMRSKKEVIVVALTCLGVIILKIDIGNVVIRKIPVLASMRINICNWRFLCWFALLIPCGSWIGWIRARFRIRTLIKISVKMSNIRVTGIKHMMRI